MRPLLALFFYLLWHSSASSQINPDDTSIYSTIYQVNGSDYEMYLIRINTDIGLGIQLSGAPVANGFNPQHGATIDPFKNIFYFSDGGNLVSVDIATGNLIGSVPLNNDTYEDFSQMHFNYADSTIYALNYISYPENETRLAKIDPVSGAVSDINTLPTGIIPFVSDFAIDASLNKAYLCGSALTIIDSIYTVDLLTGSVVDRQALSFDGVFNDGYNNNKYVKNLAFDIVQKKLYGIYRNESPASSNIAVIDVAAGNATTLTDKFSDHFSNGAQSTDIDPVKGIIYRQVDPTILNQFSSITGIELSSDDVMLPLGAGFYNFNVLYPYYLSQFVSVPNHGFVSSTPHLFSTLVRDQILIRGLQSATTIMNLYDESGRLILTKTTIYPSSTIDISSLADGFYIIQVGSGDTFHHFRFVKETN